MRVWDVDRQLAGAGRENEQPGDAQQPRSPPRSSDLKQGTEAIEERARYELGMVAHDESLLPDPEQ